MKKGTLLLFAAMLLIAPSTLFAEGQQESGVPTLRFSHGWGGADPRGAIFESMLDEYIASVGDGVVIEPEFVFSTDRIQKVQVDVASGNPPDVFIYWASESNLGDMARNDVLVPMSELLPELEVERDQFFGWETTNIDGEYYGIPIEAFSGFFLANQSLFDEHGLEIPTTMAELEDVSAEFREAGIVPFAMSSQAGDPGHLFFSSLVYQFEGGLEDTQAMYQSKDFDYAANRRAAEVIADLIEMNALPEDTISNGGWAPQTALFTSGRAAMIHSFPWMTGDFVNNGTPEDYVVADIPNVDGGGRASESFNVGGISAIVTVSRKGWDDPAKREHIIDFVNWLVSDELQRAMIEEAGHSSAKLVEYDMSSLTQLERDIIAKQQTEDLLPMHEEFFENTEEFDFYKRSIDELFAGLPPEEFIERVQRQLNQ